MAVVVAVAVAGGVAHVAPAPALSAGGLAFASSAPALSSAGLALVVPAPALSAGGLALAAESDCPGNLLVNPGFEDGFSARGRVADLVANGWSPWFERLPGVGGINYAPEYAPRSRWRDGANSVFSGQWSQEQATQGATHTAGVWQRVGVADGSRVAAHVFAFAWASDGDSSAISDPPGTYAMAFGLDPTGGTDPAAASVQWSVPITVTDMWVPLGLEAIADGEAVTIFTRGQPLEILRHNVSRWDGACLRVVARPGEPTFTTEPVARPTGTLRPGDPTATATPDLRAGTQAALDVGLALDVAATSAAQGTAAAGGSVLVGPGQVPASGFGAGPGSSDPGASGATPAGEAAGPTVLGDGGAPAAAAGGDGGSSRSPSDWLGLAVLALAALVGGAVFGLGRRRPGDGSASSAPDDAQGAHRPDEVLVPSPSGAPLRPEPTVTPEAGEPGADDDTRGGP